MFDVMDEDEENEETSTGATIFGDMLSQSSSGSRTTCPSPDTPTVFSPEFTEDYFFQPFLLQHRIQAVRQLKLLDRNMNYFSFNRKQGDSFQKEINKEEGLKIKVQEVAEEIHKDPGDLNATNGSSNMKCHARSIENKQPPLTPPPPPLIPKNSSLPHDQHPQTPHPPTPPPTPDFKGTTTVPPPPPPLLQSNRMAQPPPPPPGGMAKALQAKKANNKLKRSTLMGKLYHVLKGRLEGKNLRGNLSQGKKAQLRATADGKQGMAEALAEMTKRFAYHFERLTSMTWCITFNVAWTSKFIVGHHTFSKLKKMSRTTVVWLPRLELPLLLLKRRTWLSLLDSTDTWNNNWRNWQMRLRYCLFGIIRSWSTGPLDAQGLASHQIQVLARFEGFPTKKLEALRMAAALYKRLEGIHTELENWRVEPPLNQLLDKVESYFNKVWFCYP